MYLYTNTLTNTLTSYENAATGSTGFHCQICDWGCTNIRKRGRTTQTRHDRPERSLSKRENTSNHCHETKKSKHKHAFSLTPRPTHSFCCIDGDIFSRHFALLVSQVALAFFGPEQIYMDARTFMLSCGRP